MNKVSIKDIAQKAGVSITTVSIVLNGNGTERKISPSKIKKIMDVAAELNYRPNQQAKSLRTGKTYTLGLIVDDISNFFFSHLAKTVEEEADKFGYTVMFCSSENDEGKSRNVLGTLLNKQMDGYLIAPTSGMQQEINQLVQENKPLVLVDRFFQNSSASYVALDNYKGTFDSVTHLAKQGYSKIAIVTNDSEQIQLQERFEGYKTALRKHKIPFVPEYVKKIPFKFSAQKTVREIESFVAANPDIDAILFTSNNLGIPGLEGLRNLNKKVGNDIAVICFDDNDHFRLASPSITVISQPIRAIGKNALKILLDQIDKKELKQVKSVLLPNLIVRESTPVKASVVPVAKPKSKAVDNPAKGKK
ncbi:MAG TPA: LacI family DNA-binding transcriptional regulator [Chitinophagaceae bacterium]|nr:LacI family DNA-binding transcriptional regulator [Chitinophagaceae bacterium]